MWWWVVVIESSGWNGYDKSSVAATAAHQVNESRRCTGEEEKGGGGGITKKASFAGSPQRRSADKAMWSTRADGNRGHASVVMCFDGSLYWWYGPARRASGHSAELSLHLSSSGVHLGARLHDGPLESNKYNEGRWIIRTPFRNGPGTQYLRSSGRCGHWSGGQGKREERGWDWRGMAGKGSKVRGGDGILGILACERFTPSSRPNSHPMTIYYADLSV